MNLPLTICIPTFNREAELRQALNSIRTVFGAGVSVVVSDNASTDNTKVLCQEYADEKAFRSFLYFRWDENQGPDRNYLKAVELAETEYCMLLGSDDAFEPTACNVLAEAITAQSDIALFARHRYNRDMSKERGVEQFWKDGAPSHYHLRNDVDYEMYIKNCTSLAGFFSYLSAILFRRRLWIENDRVREFVGSAYVHVAALLEGARSQSSVSLRICREPTIKCRMDNDFFLSSGHLRRFTIDWDGYEKLGETYFSSRPRILTQLLDHQASLKSLAGLRFHLARAGDQTAIRYVGQRLRASPWGRRAMFRWALLGLIPMPVLALLYAQRQKKKD